MPAFTCPCGVVTHYGWRRDGGGERWCEPCGAQVMGDEAAAKEKKAQPGEKKEASVKPKRTRRKL
jgi:hypothetical protein